MFASELVPILIFGTLLATVPESLRWLALRGRMDAALAVLNGVNGPGVASREMDEIRKSLRREVGSFRELFAPPLRPALLLRLFAAVFTMTTGYVTVNWLHAQSSFRRQGSRRLRMRSSRQASSMWPP